MILTVLPSLTHIEYSDHPTAFAHLFSFIYLLCTSVEYSSVLLNLPYCFFLIFNFSVNIHFVLLLLSLLFRKQSSRQQIYL